MERDGGRETLSPRILPGGGETAGAEQGLIKVLLLHRLTGVRCCLKHRRQCETAANEGRFSLINALFRPGKSCSQRTQVDAGVVDRRPPPEQRRIQTAGAPARRPDVCSVNTAACLSALKARLLSGGGGCMQTTNIANVVCMSHAARAAVALSNVLAELSCFFLY